MKKKEDDTINNLSKLGYEVRFEDRNIITFDPSKNEIHLVL